MRRLLFLSYYTPPRAGVATTRTRQLVRYLPEHGWEVQVVTAELPGADENVIQTPYLDLSAAVKQAVGFGSKSAHATLGVAVAPKGQRLSLKQRAFSFGYTLLNYPDPEVGWFPRGRGVVGELLRSGRFDAILSSSPPFTTNLILASLTPKIPWVADFRDLWSDSGYYGSGVRNAVDSVLERWTLRSVDAVTTISEPLARVLRSHRKDVPVEVIPNAFDPEEWAGVPFELGDACTFLYAGQFFQGRRDPRPLFEAIRSLIDDGTILADEVRVDLYAKSEAWLTQAIEVNRLQPVVRVMGFVSREAVMAAERRANRLLVLLWEGANTEGIVTGKLFEYLGARRPILAVGGPERSAIDDVLTTTQSGGRVRTAAALKEAVRAAVEEHRAHRVPIVDAEHLIPFSASTIAGSFARLLDRVVDAQHIARPAI
ncbi:MAG: glycosyltransferase [Candidatus Eremiobacteraeota bacterium]|nr:glycosyltransferase [Candidatus Eremiobacteraeota bacterium]